MDREPNSSTVPFVAGCPVCEAASRANIPVDAPEDWIRVEAITVTFERDGLSDFFDTDEAMDAAAARVRAILKAENPQATVTVLMNEYKDGDIEVSGIDATGERWSVRESDSGADGGGSPVISGVQEAIQRAFEGE